MCVRLGAMRPPLRNGFVPRAVVAATAFFVLLDRPPSFGLLLSASVFGACSSTCAGVHRWAAHGGRDSFQVHVDERGCFGERQKRCRVPARREYCEAAEKCTGGVTTVLWREVSAVAELAHDERQR
mmetsp:Transcript_26710/g.39534  ORF Transcript_26710/g.39534 Transcript_26710/m.39534 type:complete len:126 (-) Transcript_26710:337-714(-)